MVAGIDIIIILAYFGVMVLAGIIGNKLTGDHEEFLVAGRNLPMWVFFPCLSSVVLGGSATFGAVTLAYKFGVSGFWLVFMYGVGILALGFLLTGKLANLKVISLSEMLEIRYDKNTRYISAVIGVVYAAMIAVLQVIAIGTILNSLIGWDLVTSMIVGGGIALTYTMVGGMLAVSITDVIQFALMVVGVFCLLLPEGFELVGGWAGLKQQLAPTYFDPFAIGKDKIVAYVLMLVLGIMIGQDVWQRIFTAKTNKAARTGTIAAGVFCWVWAGAMAVIGMMAVVLVPGLENGQSALPKMVIQTLKPGYTGLVLAGLISALMSTISGTILASSTLILNDIILPMKKGLSEKEALKLSMITTGTVGLLVIIFAIWIQDVLVALDISYALLSGSIFVPVFAGFFWKRANAKGALCSILVSSLVICIDLAIEGVSSTNAIVYGVITSVIVLVIASLLTEADSESRMEEWEARMNGDSESTASDNNVDSARVVRDPA